MTEVANWLPPIDQMSLRELKEENKRLLHSHRAAVMMYEAWQRQVSYRAMPRDYMSDAKLVVAVVGKSCPEFVKLYEEGF